MSVEFDKMMGALGMLSGSKAGAQKAFDAASAMYAPVEEVNPWEASLRFFLEMGKQASQPGATVFGSAVGAGLVPLDYLAAKKKEKRDRDQKVASTAFSLAPSLKPKAGKVTYRPATAEELKQYGKTSGQIGICRICQCRHFRQMVMKRCPNYAQSFCNPVLRDTQPVHTEYLEVEAHLVYCTKISYI